MCELLSEIGSGLDEGLKAPANWAWEVITCADRIDSKYKKVRIDAGVDALIDDPQDSTITSWDNDPDVRLTMVYRFFYLLELVKFLLVIE